MARLSKAQVNAIANIAFNGFTSAATNTLDSLEKRRLISALPQNRWVLSNDGWDWAYDSLTCSSFSVYNCWCVHCEFKRRYELREGKLRAGSE